MVELYTKRVIDELIKLEIKLQNLQIKNRYHQSDTRQKTITSLNGSVKTCLLCQNLLHSFELRRWPRQFSKSILGLDIQDPDAVKQLKIFAQYQKLSFIIMVNFQVEIFLRIIYSELENKNPPENYSDVIKDTLKSVNIPNRSEKFLALYTLARIRNSLHSGSIHTKKSVKKYKIKNYDFEFIRGEPLHCVSWLHISAVVDEIIDIIDEIILSPKIKKITKNIGFVFIPKLFAKR